ncbi:MAG: DUF4215 domain-containing protein, partial [Candidatus Woesearchaeota archaeon]|nr:DUF4215 domain-containing protein [Candidatus Woesearchaeota archaeon]
MKEKEAKLERFREITLEKRLFNKKYFWLYLVLGFVILIAGVLLFFNSQITGFVVFDTFTYTKDYNLTFQNSSVYYLDLGEGLSSLRFSGRLLGEGSAKVYLEADRTRRLVLDSREEVDDGIAIAQPGDVEVYANESDKDARKIDLALDYRKGTIYDDNDDGIETEKGIIDITVEKTMFNWLVDESRLCTVWEVYAEQDGSSTVFCRGDEQCCNLQNLSASAGQWNELLYLYKGLYDASDNNTVSAQIKYVDYNLSLENAFIELHESSTASVEADFIEKVRIFDKECIESCVFSRENSSDLALIVELDNARLELDFLTYKVEKARNVTEIPPLASKKIPDLLVYKNENISLNLSNYFEDPDSAMLNYSGLEVIGLEMVFNQDIVTFIPEINLTGVFFTFITANDSKHIAVGDIFNITVKERIEINLSEETVQQPLVLLGQPVRWTKKILLSNKTDNITLNITPEASNIIVRKIVDSIVEEVDEDNILIDYKGEKQSLAEYEIVKEVEAIEETIDALNKEKRENIVDSDRVRGINQELVQLDTRRDTLTGAVIFESEGKGIVTRFFEWIFINFDADITGAATLEDENSGIGGDVGDNGDEGDATNIIIEEEVEEVEIEYTTPGPVAEEKEFSAKRKEIIISSDIHYENILAFTKIPDSPADAINLFHINNNSREPTPIYDMQDTNGDGKIDEVYWIVPHLSNQTYEIVIRVKDAEHLDENKDVVENVFELVVMKDGNLTEPIPVDHFLRITFERFLTNVSDITIVGESNGSEDAYIEVYYYNSSELITTIDGINEYGTYRTDLLDLVGSGETFDLKIKGAAIRFDQAVDPDVTACSALTTDSTTYTLTADLTASGTCISIQGIDITFDCNHKQIAFPADTDGVEAIVVNNSEEITIKNCNIVGSSLGDRNYGLLLRNVTNATLTHINITADSGDPNTYFVFYNHSYNVSLTRGNITSDNSDADSPFLVVNSNFTRIEKVNITSAGGSELLLIHNSTFVIINESIFGATANGIDAVVISGNSMNTTLLNNSLINIGVGFTLSNISGGLIENTTIGNNSFDAAVELFIQGNAANRTSLVDQPIGNHSILPTTLLIQNSTYGILEYLGPVSSIDGSSNLYELINISNNTISVNSDSGLNASANITFFDINFRSLARPSVVRNNAICNATLNPTCFNFTSLEASTVIFNVSTFSNYSIGDRGIACGDGYDCPNFNDMMDPIDTCVDTTNNQSPNRCIANLTQCNNFLGKACSMYTTASGVVNTGICTTNAGCRNDSITSSQYGTGITGGTAPDFHDGNAKSGCEAEDVGKICNTSIGTYIIAGGSGVCDPSPSCVESMAFFLNCSKVGCDASYFKVNSVSISCDSSYAGWACDSVVDGSGFSQDGICDGMDTCRTSGHICNSSTGLEHNGCGGANCVDDDPCITTFTAGNFNESLGVCDGAACVALGSNNKIYDAPTNDLTAPYFANGSINSTIINESVYYDNQTINLSHPTWGLRFKVFAHFEQDNVNLTNLSINASATKTVVNGTLISGVEQNYTILVANTSALGVYICPNATILEHVNISCPDKVSFTYEDARDGMFDPIFPGNNLAKGTYYVGMWNGTIYEIWNVTGNAGIGENDTIPPNITIDTPINETYGRSSFEINVSTNEETSACLFSLNETANVTMDKINISHFRYLYPEFAPGSNNLTVYCNDTLGNFNNTEPLRFFFIKNSSACTNATQCDLSGPDVPFGDTIDSCLDTDSDNVPDRCYSANPYCNVTLGQSCEFYDTYESGDLAQGICTPQGCINTTIASGEVGNLITGGAIFDFHGGDEVGYCSEDTEGQICNSSVQGFDPQPEGICEASNCVVDTLISMNCDGPCTAAQISSETLVSTCGESEDGWACNTQVNGSGFYQNGTCDGSNCQFTGYLCNTTISGDIILNGCGGAGECAKQDPCDSNLTDGNFNNSYANCNSRGQCILNGQGDIYDAPADDLTAPYFANGSVNYSIINETIYFSNQTLNLSHPSLGLRAAFYVHFDRGDVNLTNVTINASDTRTFINATLFSGADSNFTLYVPNSSALGVYVCPNATELEHVNTSCPNLVGFSNEEARDGMYATAGIDRITRGTVYAEMGNMSYYKIWNITGAVGIGENDTIPPNITIVLPKNTTYARHNLSLNVSLNENTSACLYSLNGTANVSMDRIADTNFNASLTFLAPGRNNVTVSCNDTLGNFNNSAVHLFYVKYGDTCTTSGGCLIDGGAGDPYMENTDMCVDTTGNNAPDSCFINSTGCPGRIGRSCNYTDGSIASAGICTSKGGCVNYSIMSGEFGTLLPGGTAADFHGGNEVFGCGDDETGFICNDTNAQFDPVGGGICVTSICMVASDVSLNCGSACTTGDISSISMVMGCTTGGYSCDSNVDANGFGQDGICNGTGCQTNGYICNATMTGDLYSDCDSCMQRDPCDTTFTDGDFNADGGKCKKGICSTANVAPVIYDVSLSTSTDFNDTNDDLNCYVNASDPDGDQIDAYLRWFVQGVENSYTEITTTSVVASYPTNTDENVSVLVDTLSYTNTSAGQNWTCMVIVGDEDNNATSFVNASLQISGSLAAGSCGDGILDSGEECDDGNSVSSDGCSSSCTNEGSSPAAAAAADAAVAVAVAVAEVAEVQVFEAEQVAVMAEFAEVLGIEVAELALVQAEAVTEQQVEFEEAALTDDQIAAIIQQALDIEAQLALDLEIPEEVAEEIAEAVVEAEEVVALVAEVAEIAEGEVTAEGVLAGEQAAAAAAAASSVAAPGRAQESRTKVGEAIKVVAQLAKEKKAVVVKQDIPTPKEETITKEPIKENDGQTYYAQVVQETSEDKLAEKVIAKPVAKINELSEIKQTKQEKIQSLAKELGSLEKDLAKVTEKSPVILKMVKVIKEIKKENKDLTALNTQLNKLKAGSVASGEAGQTSEAAAADGSVDGGSTGLLGGVSGITGAVVLGEEGPSKIGLSENSDSMQSVISCVKSTRIPSQYSEPIRFAASRSDVTVPEGFEEIVSPFKVNCGEDSTRISLNIPGKYDEVSLIKCDGINCSTQGVELLEQLNCGSKLDEVERITDTLGENEFPLKLQGVISRITPQKNVLRSGRNKIRFINEVTLDIAATKPFSDVPHPANTKLKIMSTPMIVFFKQSDKKLNVEITMPYVSSDYTLEDNLALYYFKDNEWNYLGGEI